MIFAVGVCQLILEVLSWRCLAVRWLMPDSHWLAVVMTSMSDSKWHMADGNNSKCLGRLSLHWRQENTILKFAVDVDVEVLWWWWLADEQWLIPYQTHNVLVFCLRGRVWNDVSVMIFAVGVCRLILEVPSWRCLAEWWLMQDSQRLVYWKMIKVHRNGVNNK